MADHLSRAKRKYLLIAKRPKWKKILSSSGFVKDIELERAQRVLFATSIGCHLPGTTLDSLLVQSVKMRGANVSVLLCDALLPCCLEGTIERYPNVERYLHNGQRDDLCKDCFEPAQKLFESLNVPVCRYTDFISKLEREFVDSLTTTLDVSDMISYRWNNIKVGEHCLAGVLRFLGRGTLREGDVDAPIVRMYFRSALLTAIVIQNAMKKLSPDVVVSHHGIYVPFGLIRDCAVNSGARFVTWIPSYRKNSFIFSHEDTYHHTLMTEPVATWEKMEWNRAVESELMDYLQSRRKGTRDWIWFHEKPEEDADSILKALGVDPLKPCVGLLTNVMWDAQLHYPANAFPSMLHWILESIKYFQKRRDLQLIVRVHPAEIRGNRASRQPVMDEIGKYFPKLPENVFLIEPGSHSSTYAVMERCNAVLIYGTKMGVELASLGVPVVVAGEAWVRNKGFTWDAKNAFDYFNYLDQLPFPSRMSPEKILRARRYAFHFFFRRMIPLSLVKPEPHPLLFSLNVGHLNDLLPRKNRALDVICDGILKGTDFVFPAESYY